MIEKKGAGALQRGAWALLAAMGVAAPAVAQDNTAPAASDETIYVTATRRETRLQDVPLALSPMDAELIQKSGIRDIQDLTSVTPSLQFVVTESETNATARLRGVGTQGSNPGLESAVGVFIDGVYRARNGVALGDLGEIKQVEVLRGPQGTLFGRNTTAGLISITTSAPSLDGGVHVDASATYGDYNETRVDGAIDATLVEDQLGVRLYGAYGKRDGFMDVYDFAGNKTELNDRDVWTVRGQALWEPNADISLRIIGDYATRDEFCCAAQIIDPIKLSGNIYTNHPGATPDTVAYNDAATRVGAIANLGGYGGGPGTYTSAQIAEKLRGGDIDERIGFANRTYDQKIDDAGISAELNWKTGIGKFTSITAYRDWQFTQGQDVDFSAADILYRPTDGNQTSFKILTQEFRLAGENGRWDWLVGGFFAHEELDRDYTIATGTQYGQYFALLDDVLGGPGLYSGVASVTGAFPSSHRDRFEQESNSASLFTHNILSITENDKLTMGLRYTSENKKLNASYSNPGNTAALLGAFQSTVPALGGSGAAFTASNYCDATFFDGVNTLAGRRGLALLRSGYCLPWLRPSAGNATQAERRDREFSGFFAYSHKFSNSLTSYASYSRGYKAGGYNLDRDYDGDPSFAAEKVDAYELGAKLTLAGGDLLLNGAVFYNKFTNFQLNTFNGLSFFVTSIPEVKSQGGELDVIWKTPLDGLSYQGGAALVSAQYGEDNGWVAADANPLTLESSLNRLPNSELTNSPSFTMTHALSYEVPMFGLNGLFYVDGRYTSDQNTGSDLRPSKQQPNYWLVNARFGLSTQDEHWSLEFWGRNILDESYAQVIFDTPLQQGTNGGTQAAFLGDPRTFGVTIRARY